VLADDVSLFVQFVMNQGVAIAVLAWFMIRLEQRLERIDRLMTLWADHQGLLDDGGNPKLSLR
jgi:site-specific recombinase